MNHLLYIDPNIGSLILQIAVAGIAAFGAVWLTLKTKIKNLFTKQTEDSGDDSDKEEQL